MGFDTIEINLVIHKFGTPICDMDKMNNEINIFTVSNKKNNLIKLKESNKSNE